MLRVRILGELQLELDGQPLRLPARRPARALLGWLAVHPGMHARGAVAAQLWPNVLDESARVSLRSALAALRSAIGPASDWAVPATRAVVGLAGLPGVWVDAREFDRLLSDKFAQEALDLCRGELLTGFDEDWVLATRDEHRARQAEALGTLARAAVATGDHEAAVALARRRARLDPFDETAHRELISLLGDGGDRGGALIAYQRLAERLRRELGVAPSPTTRALAAKLRETSRSVETQPSAPASDRREHGPQRPLKLSARIESIAQSGPLFGRELQLARLHEVWTRSQPGSRRLALVTGEPGIGKTRLVSELAAELHAHGVTVLYGAAREDALVPYEPFVESLREPLRQPVELPSEAAPLASLLPELAALLRVPSDRTPLGAPAPGARLRLFDAFGVAVDAIASARPLALILEDLHWAEVSTVRLLIHLASRPGGAPQALVVTYRDTELGGRHPLADGLADLYRALPVEQIGLQGIGTDAVAAMVTDDM